MKFKSEQEAFWAGSFGSDYIERNQGPHLLAANVNFFSRALRIAPKIETCIEFGANIGMNLAALKILYPDQKQFAVEINSDAVDLLSRVVDPASIANVSISDFESTRSWDLAIIKGVLIHIAPELLPGIYEKLVRSCGRFLLVAEYYNPVPVAIPYRGFTDRLFKRDFGGEILDAYPEMHLIDYGFCYRRDPSFPQDDITWFLLEKRSL
jgi:pseudaminic acid biosynthesis-associated methylase